MTNVTKILPDDPPSIVAFAKLQIAGHSTQLEKHHYYDALSKRADALYGDTLTREQRFTKTITEDDVGKLLFKALRAAPGVETTTAPGDTPEVENPADFKGRPA